MSESWLKRAAMATMFVGAITAGAAYAQTAPAAPDAGQTSGGEATKPKPKPSRSRQTQGDQAAFGRGRGDQLAEGGFDGTRRSFIRAWRQREDSGALAAGKKVVIHVEHDKPCLFDLHGVFDDLTTTEEASVDLCTEKKINLVE